ncbi:MAG: phosphatidylglycerophosphatase A [Alcanivorax sp.]|uniref:phosphatidylglycerophosphatase A family protein n=1 Tax=Alloalcanivorax marinus TaxID=1177169 RepID=UPI00195B85EF|nr:phosphatidylglycerophosphatase A [Alloalcanivorax marinus]MBM7334602.1 phosphatidylglycerophosphatase A [Alloalcanivorax marinus]
MHPESFLVLLAQGLGAGLSPWAPGTVASLLFLLLWWPLARLSRPRYLLVVLLVAVAGVPLCGLASGTLGVHDAASVVWDELGGLLLALAVVPRHPGWGLAGFAAFRFFDVLKPGPVGWVDLHLNGGLGIVLDDLVAGGLALVVLWLMVWGRGRGGFSRDGHTD